MFDISFFAIVGFMFAAYAVVGNDALQTLGTFINANSRLHWGWLFLFPATILVATFTYGWVVNGGDPSYGRLDNTDKYPVVDIQWYHVLPPAVLLLITRFGIPVSTSFMVLTVFASIGGMSSMLQKSIIGYGLAFVVGLVLYMMLSNTLEKVFRDRPDNQYHPGWVIAQWLTTAYLWSVWLIQDFANIFVFLPRELSALESFAAMFGVIVLLAYTFANKGGPVQRILLSKTSVSDIRSATIINFTYASLLFYFKELSNIPMSTTFVFLGLIAGREYAFAMMTRTTSFLKTCMITVSDLSKAIIGLVLSIDMAVGLPALARTMSGEEFSLTQALPAGAYQNFFVISNLLLVAVGIYLLNQTQPRMIATSGIITAALVAFFVFPIS